MLHNLKQCIVKWVYIIHFSLKSVWEMRVFLEEKGAGSPNNVILQWNQSQALDKLAPTRCLHRELFHPSTSS